VRILGLLIFSSLAFAAQDATITNAFTLSNSSVPAQFGHCTVEGVISGQSNPANGNIFGGSNPCNLRFVWNFTGGVAFADWTRGIGGEVIQFGFGTALHPFRIQIDPATDTLNFDVWDQNCTLTNSGTLVYPGHTGSPSNGQSITGTDSTGFRLSWLRISTDTIPAGSSCPTTAATGRTFIAHWKFEGNLNDSSGNGYTLTGGTPSYTPTLSAFANLVVSVICSSICSSQLAYAPLLPSGTAVSVRAAVPAIFDGSLSFSQADASSTVSYSWSSTAGPSTPSWDSQVIATPTVTNLVFGDYSFKLDVTDSAANTASSTVHIGAVATDANGIVSTGIADADFMLGPLIAFGKNPWGYQDYWHAHASSLRAADYALPVSDQGQSYPGWSTLGKPQWEFYGAGTVSFNWNCVGNPYFCQGTGTGTTLNGSCSSTSTSCTVGDITKLDVSVLPTRIIIYDGTNFDEMRVCSVASNTLTWCYDPNPRPRHTFSNGTNVIQSKITGSGTSFLTDATAPLCPVGAGPVGVSVYSTGTITLTAGSATVTLSGGTFPTYAAGDFLRVAATHSATPFTFVAKITSRDSTTQLTLERVFPSDADTASGLAYNIMPVQRTPVLEYASLYRDPTHTPTDTQIKMFGGSWCESETAFYLNPIQQGSGGGLGGNAFAWHQDIPALNGTLHSGLRYSVTDTTGWVNQSPVGGINFYGEGMAHRSLYLRSGLTSAYDAAGIIDNYWIHSPWGQNGGTPRLYLGGGGIGAFLSKLTDPSTLVSWVDLRFYAQMGKDMVDGIAANGCNAWADSRDSGYAYTWLILSAIYDPDTTSTAAPGGIPWRTYWQNQLAQMQTNDTNCQRADKSFANGFYLNLNAPQVSLTNGNPNGTGTGIPTSVCSGVGAVGTATVTNGSNALSVVIGSIPTGKILYLTGTSGGNPFFQALAYSGTGASATLGGNWLGDSGTIAWVASTLEGNPSLVSSGSSPGPMLTFAQNNDDINLKKNYACTWISSSLIVLDRPFEGASGTYLAYNTNLAGYGQQPFMLGIKSYGMNLLATQTVPALSAYVAPYQTFAEETSDWIWNTGMDPNILGTNYGRVFQQCEPTNVSPVGTSLGFRAPGCTYGLDTDSQVLSREQNAETGNSHTVYYRNNTTAPNKTQGDKWYGALWGTTAYNTGGVYQDAFSTANNVGRSNFPDAYIHAGKWFGFFAGVGISGSWPAVRIAVTVQPTSSMKGTLTLKGNVVIK
jgi:hypothetical protein